MNVRKVTLQSLLTTRGNEKVNITVFYTDLPIKDIVSWVSKKNNFGSNTKIKHIDLLDGFMVKAD